jgi:hypothetical protein
MNTTPCKGCGKPIFWAETPDGRRVPLDPKPPVYVADKENGRCERVAREFMVTHFATCPEANTFSRTPGGKSGK